MHSNVSGLNSVTPSTFLPAPLASFLPFHQLVIPVRFCVRRKQAIVRFPNDLCPKNERLPFQLTNFHGGSDE
jgi:hypothetical protein